VIIPCYLYITHLLLKGYPFFDGSLGGKNIHVKLPTIKAIKPEVKIF